MSEEKNQEKPGCLASGARMMLVYFVVIIVGLGIFYLNGYGGMAIQQNRDLQRTAKISLNEVLGQGGELPIGEYVSLDAYQVLTKYASMTNTKKYRNRYTGEQALAEITEVTYAYCVTADDGTVLTVLTCNTEEIEYLDKASVRSASLIDRWLFQTNAEKMTLQGKLTEIKNENLKNLYTDALESVGLSPDDPKTRYVMLDTSKGREHVYGILTLPIVAIVAFVVYRNQKKKKAEAR